MNDNQKTSAALTGLTLLFIGLALAFWLSARGGTARARQAGVSGPVFTNTATVRLSVEELTKAGGDVSGLDCAACHTKDKPVAPRFDSAGKLIPSVAHRDVVFSRMNCPACHAPAEKIELKWDTEGRVVIPAAHTNDVPRHGRTIGNEHCFNCHDATNLAELHTAGGKKLKLTESTLLCASCHGPSYRDWEAGVHGRRNGFWNTKLGNADRKHCTSCHDPHAPALPLMKPLPPPFNPNPEAAHGARPSGRFSVRPRRGDRTPTARSTLKRRKRRAPAAAARRARSAAVLGRSDVRTHGAFETNQGRTALHPAAPGDGRTPAWRRARSAAVPGRSDVRTHGAFETNQRRTALHLAAPGDGRTRAVCSGCPVPVHAAHERLLT